MAPPGTEVNITPLIRSRIEGRPPGSMQLDLTILRHHGGEAISIDVCVDKAALSADEGQLSPHDLAILDPEAALYVSICGGACKHRGNVPLENILSICDANGTVIYRAELPAAPGGVPKSSAGCHDGRPRRR
jgi:hypothetical protein